MRFDSEFAGGSKARDESGVDCHPVGHEGGDSGVFSSHTEYQVQLHVTGAVIPSCWKPAAV